MTAERQNGPAAARKRLERACRWILIGGVVARLFAFHVMSPFNSDDHLAVVQFLEQTGWLASALDLNQGYHPPLFYLLAYWPWVLFHNAKVVQGLSLVFSLATLWALDRLLAMPRALSPRWRPWCLAMAAFHPEFILYTLYLSNDSLTIFLGTMLMLAMAEAQQRMTRCDGRGVAAVAGFLGLGLLTKGTFLAFLPPVAIFLFFLEGGRKPFARRLAGASGWILLAVLFGCYKYVENARLFHHPFVANLDFPYGWIRRQRGVWQGWKSLDINVFRLVAEPEATDWSRHAPAVFLFATYWYMHISEKTFFGNRLFFDVVGSPTYIAALGPTYLMFAGAWRVAAGGRDSEEARRRRMLRGTCVAMVALNLVLVVYAGLHYDVWSVFQGRLLYPAYAGGLIAMGAGLDGLRRSRRLSARWLKGFLVDLNILYVLFVVYLLIELGVYVYFKYVHFMAEFG